MYPWFMRSTVIHGYGRGSSELQVPTANLKLSDEILAQLSPFYETVLCGWGCIEAPAIGSETSDGASLQVPSGPYPFVMSVSTNPHFKNPKVSVEPHFLHKFEKDFYGAVVRIVVLGKIRDSVAFKSIDDLRAQINDDCIKGREFLHLEKNIEWKSNDLLQPIMPSPYSLPSFVMLSD